MTGASWCSEGFRLLGFQAQVLDYSMSWPARRCERLEAADLRLQGQVVQ